MATTTDPTLEAPRQEATEADIGLLATAFAETIGAPEVRGTALPDVRYQSGKPALSRVDKPRYAELRTLGEGGVGEVALAEDHDIGRAVAIKRLRAGVTGDAALARFVQEVRVMGQLEHPNIVPVHDVGVDASGRLYFVMKQIEGETLEAIIDKLRAGDGAYRRKYDVGARVEIFQSVLRAAQFSHARKIVHRDIKPSNVMVGRFGEVVLMDWGIAKNLDKPGNFAGGDAAPPAEDDKRAAFRTQNGALLGTPAYMAPEQARGDNDAVDERTDLYALAALFYEFLTLEHHLGELTSIAALLESVENKLPRHPFLVRKPNRTPVPLELGNFVMQGLAKEPEKRYQTAGEMIEALHRAATGTFSVSCHLTLTKRILHAAIQGVDAHPIGVTMLLALGVLSSVAGLVLGVAHLVR